MDGRINRESYVSKAKVICAKEIADLDEHNIYAVLSARAVKFAKKDDLLHGKSIHPWFNNVQPQLFLLRYTQQTTYQYCISLP